MGRLDVFRNQHGNGYLLDLQTDLLDSLNTRTVAPLFLRSEFPVPARSLNPLFEVEGRQVVMMTQYLATIPESELTDCITNLKEHHSDITGALDMLFLGF